MNRRTLLALGLLSPLGSLIALHSPAAWADASSGALQAIQTRWAEIQYQLPPDARSQALAELATTCQQSVEAQPQAADLRIWNGIVLSSWAGAKGGLGALGLVKRAKAELEQALALDERALQGSAYTSLGSLYHQVPGWPIGFGDQKKAEQMFKKALAINPNGIDPNYFYGLWLVDQKRLPEAAGAIKKALQAPPRPGREVADLGRRDEAQRLLQTVPAQ